MAKEIKKTIRIPPEILTFIKCIASSLNISENDAIKMIFFEYFRNTREGIFK